MEHDYNNYGDGEEDERGTLREDYTCGNTATYNTWIVVRVQLVTELVETGFIERETCV